MKTDKVGNFDLGLRVGEISSEISSIFTHSINYYFIVESLHDDGFGYFDPSRMKTCFPDLLNDRKIYYRDKKEKQILKKEIKECKKQLERLYREFNTIRKENPDFEDLPSIESESMVIETRYTVSMANLEGALQICDGKTGEFDTKNDTLSAVFNDFNKRMRIATKISKGSRK